MKMTIKLSRTLALGLALQALWITPLPLASSVWAQEHPARAAAASEKTDIEELASTVRANRTRPPAFEFIAAEAKKLGLRAWIFGGGATSLVHYAEQEARFRRDQHEAVTNYFDYDLDKIFSPTQDIDVILDGSADQCAALEASLNARFARTQLITNRSAWEVRPMYVDRAAKVRLFTAPGVPNPELVNQHSDSFSNGLVELTNPPKPEMPIVTDLRNPNGSSDLLRDISERKITYYHSSRHQSTARAKAGENPEILSVLRLLNKALRFDVSISSEHLHLIKGIIAAWDPATPLGTYATSRLEHEAKKIPRNAQDLHHAWKLLSDLGLLQKLQQIGSPGVHDSTAWWMSRVPLEPKPLGTSGKTAQDLKLTQVAHDVADLGNFKSLQFSLSIKGFPNLFISRAGVPGEAAVYGDGLYTMQGTQGAHRKNSLVFDVHPMARRGSDFQYVASGILFLNRNALSYRLPIQTVSVVDYFRFLAGDPRAPALDTSVSVKFDSRLEVLNTMSTGDKDEIQALVAQTLRNSDSVSKSDILFKAWRRLPAASDPARHGAILSGLFASRAFRKSPQLLDPDLIPPEQILSTSRAVVESIWEGAMAGHETDESFEYLRKLGKRQSEIVSESSLADLEAEANFVRQLISAADSNRAEIARQAPASAIEAIRQRVSSPTRTIRAHAIRMLQLMVGHPSAPELFARAVNDPDPSLREYVLGVLRHRPGAQNVAQAISDNHMPPDLNRRQDIASLLRTTNPLTSPLACLRERLAGKAPNALTLSEEQVRALNLSTSALLRKRWQALPRGVKVATIGTPTLIGASTLLAIRTKRQGSLSRLFESASIIEFKQACLAGNGEFSDEKATCSCPTRLDTEGGFDPFTQTCATEDQVRQGTCEDAEGKWLDDRKACVCDKGGLSFPINTKVAHCEPWKDRCKSAHGVVNANPEGCFCSYSKKMFNPFVTPCEDNVQSALASGDLTKVWSKVASSESDEQELAMEAIRKVPPRESDLEQLEYLRKGDMRGVTLRSFIVKRLGALPVTTRSTSFLFDSIRIETDPQLKQALFKLMHDRRLEPAHTVYLRALIGDEDWQKRLMAVKLAIRNNREEDINLLVQASADADPEVYEPLYEHLKKIPWTPERRELLEKTIGSARDETVQARMRKELASALK